MTPNTKIALVVVGLVVYLAAGYFLLVSRQGKKAADLQEQIALVEDQITAARTTQHTQQSIEPVHVADLFRLSKAMPDATDMPGLLLELNEVARETGIEFNSIAPQPAVAAGPFSAVPIDLVFDGDYYDLADFLYRSRTLVDVRDGKLDARGRLFNVESVDFTEGPDHFPQIRAKLRVEAYVYGGVPAAAPGVAPAAGATGAEGATPTPDPSTPPAAPSGEGATAMGATG